VDTQFIFGITAGADIGEVGEKEIENQTTLNSAKRSGSYASITNEVTFEDVPVEDLRLEVGLPIVRHDISGVAGFDDLHRTSVAGLVTSVRYKVLDRDAHPFALTLGAEPRWSRIDDVSGASVQSVGADFSLAADVVAIPGVLFAAANFLYEPDWTRAGAMGGWGRASTKAVLVSVACRLARAAFVGMEARSYWESEGLGFGRFSGRALYVGPTMFVKITDDLAISGAFGYQVSGHAAGDPASLDLENYTRREGTLRLEFSF